MGKEAMYEVGRKGKENNRKAGIEKVVKVHTWPY
jgi:hypothetical protein